MDQIWIYVFGPKSYVPEPLAGVADVNATWYDFLTGVCGLQITPDDNLMIYSTAYSAKAGTGWAAKLNEQIKDFTSKYIVKKKKYSVRLALATSQPASPKVTPTRSGIQNGDLQHANHLRENYIGVQNLSAGLQATLAALQTNTYQRQTPKEEMRSRSVFKAPAPKEIRIPGRPVASRPPVLTPETFAYIGNHEFQIHDAGYENENADEDIQDSFNMAREANSSVEIESVDNNEMVLGEEDDDDDAMSECTAVTTEERELRAVGIEVNNLKPLIEERMKRFDNCFFLRVRHEIRKLRRNKLWDRNVQRAPLCCYLLQEMFE